MPTLSMTTARRSSTVSGTKATLDVVLQGFTVGQQVELSFVEKADHGGGGAERILGTVQGRIAVVSGRTTTPRFSIIPDAPPPAAPTASAGQPPPTLIAFRFAAPTNPDGSAGTASTYVFEISGDHVDVDEGDWWELQVRENALSLRSRVVPIARIRRQLGTSQCTYEWHGGNTASFYNDGSTDANGSGGAFKDMVDAIAAAQHFVLICDWSFQPMFCPTHGPTMADTIGQKLIAKAASVLVAIHTWDHTNIAAPDAQNDDGDDFLDEQAGGDRPDKLLWRASSHDQTGMSHHQKYVIVDCEGAGGRRAIKVFYGGLDLTQGRFDWGDHPILPADPQCAKFRTSLTLDGDSYDDWYNAEFGSNRAMPRQPWHDIHGMLQGPAAWDFLREFVGRWNVDPAYPDAQGDDGNDDIKAVGDIFMACFNAASFVQQWEPHAGPWTAQVCRSMFRSHWAEKQRTRTPARRGTHREFQWGLSGGFERSIQDSYQLAIDQAEKFIYIETQYLIGSGRHWGKARGSVANDLPERIVERINQRIGDGLPFHAYVVMPMFPEGDPVGIAAVAQRQFEWNTMEYMAKAIYRAANAAGKDWRDFLSFCFLANWNTVPAATRRITGSREQRVSANRRYMIYVHSKLMIVDDRYLIFGSANLNERSLAGDRDLEICSALWPTRGREADCVQEAQAFRRRLWSEHFGTGLPASWQDAESSACVASVRAKGRSNYINFRNMTKTAADGHLCIWPFQADASNFYVESVSQAPEGDTYIPDGVYNSGSQGSRNEWLWSSPGWHMIGGPAE